MILLTAVALAAASPFDPPLGVDHAVGGDRSQVLTLGSTHLSGHSGKWQASWLGPLLDRLAAWKPDIITIENLSGEQCETIRRAPVKYEDVWDSYCFDAAPAQAAAGLDQAAAEAGAAKLLASWPSAPTAAQRRRLALLFLASGDRASAIVQWLRLPPAERIAASGLTPALLDTLNRKSGKLNESLDVAAVLAARLGLERVYPVDDHTSDGSFEPMSKAFTDWQLAHFNRYRASPLKTRSDARDAAVRDGPSLLDFYRQMNAADAQQEQIEADFGSAAADSTPGVPGRSYVGWWETRNLRMVANIRAAFAKRPGARVLNIVGASHKPWYDQWMRQMVDVEVIDAEQVLH